MAMQNKDLPRFSIVTQKPYVKQLLLASLVLWLIVALAFVWLLWQRTDSNAYQLHDKLAASQKQASAAQSELNAIKQQLANLKRSEFISRSANSQIQVALSEKDEQIAGLKADLDFYQRLVGSSGQRHGLSVHNAEFTPVGQGVWQYTVTLTQNINRGGITSGRMRITVDGVWQGQLKSLGWTELVQDAKSPGQNFSFRYFQQLQGNIMLPNGFTPQRIKVSVSGSSGSVEQDFNWNHKLPDVGITQTKK